ncbi:putative Transcription factor domain-containing protein [Seiridium unicorne]|uniref:Transcription factor domain-containing protein n=1 Tax=Seiridium unicorne TaxID=138068 RepID=A0ABR2UPN7_9PEZI
MSEPNAGGRFQFISIQAPGDSNDRSSRRLARSHAVRRALENKRKLQQDSRDNFRVTTSKDASRSPGNNETCAKISGALFCSVSTGALDPFQTLAVDSSRLQILLSNYKARQAPEPVFSVAEELAFQSFRSVFRTGMVDPALINAVMLSLAFAVTGGCIDRECLEYQGHAISYIRERMGSLGEATSESNIGAILLLAGVEARLGMKSHVQLHMDAVQQLLNTCRAEGIYLTGGIKRAIFW